MQPPAPGVHPRLIAAADRSCQVVIVSSAFDGRSLLQRHRSAMQHSTRACCAADPSCAPAQARKRGTARRSAAHSRVLAGMPAMRLSSQHRLRPCTTAATLAATAAFVAWALRCLLQWASAGAVAVSRARHVAIAAVLMERLCRGHRRWPVVRVMLMVMPCLCVLSAASVVTAIAIGTPTTVHADLPQRQPTHTRRARASTESLYTGAMGATTAATAIVDRTHQPRMAAPPRSSSASALPRGQDAVP